MRVVYKWFSLISLAGLVACSTPYPTSKSMLLPSGATQTDQATLLSSPLASTPKAPLKPTSQPVAGNTAMPTPAVDLTESVHGIQVWAEDMRREGNYVRASVCYDLPDDSDWMIDQAILRYDGGEASLESAGLLELEPPSMDGKKSHRCDEIAFAIPEPADLSHAALIVERLRATPNEAEYCDSYLNEVQPTLDARHIGIKLECTQVNHSFDLSVVVKPDSMSQKDAERILYDFYTVSGIWVFQFDSLPSFFFDPLPYLVKAKASNFRREGDLVKIDVCIQIDNTDWDAWQVQEGVLQFSGQKDNYFGTAAQLRRISPTNAKAGKYCGTLEGFPNFEDVPATVKAADFTLTITSLVPVVEVSNLCTTYLDQVQKQLDEHMTSIRVQCGKTPTGDYALQAVDLPKSIRLSQAAMERVLGNVGLFVYLRGPWTFALE